MRQEDAFALMTFGKSVFITGSPGTGKTYLIEAYIRYLEDHDVKFAVTASTGIAASHINGQTIHSFSGLGIRSFLSPQARDELIQKEYLHKRFDGIRVLFIDEISMLSAGYLDMLDMILRDFCNPSLPFGGIQLILSGDFFQLPPIDGEFAFQSKSWRQAGIQTCYLEKSYRHKNDNTLNVLLSNIRSGKNLEEVKVLLNSRIDAYNELFDADSEHTEKDDSKKEITRLHTHNMDVDYVNGEKLSEIRGDLHLYEMTTKGKASAIEALKKSCLAPETLQLKVGALVMFVKNNPQKDYVNGTIGTVQDTSGLYPKVVLKSGRQIEVEPEVWRREDNGKVVGEISQIPLRLAWAITVHKSQGMTLDSAVIDLSKTFVAGQGYVALSRIKSLEGIYLKNYNEQALCVDEDIRLQDNLFLEQSLRIEKRLNITHRERRKEIAEAFIPKYNAKREKDVRKKEEETEREREFETYSKKGFDEKSKKTYAGFQIKKNTFQETLELILEKKSFADIVKIRNLKKETIFTHIEKLLEEEKLEIKDVEYLKKELQRQKEYKIKSAEFQEIKETFKKLGTEALKPVYDSLDGEYSYDVLKFVKAFMCYTRNKN